MGYKSPYYGNTEETPKIIEFTSLFGDNGKHYNMCTDDLEGALTDALTRLKMACDDNYIDSGYIGGLCKDSGACGDFLSEGLA
ncbi:MAG: hypothetical protein GY854_05185 [Deltaproteobacteria bacterium]|nr:hypothetical protein [Deltaproteobacteria bacterium]